MDAKRWRQIDELFHAAVECAPGQRAALLARVANGDSDLRAEVESLLAGHERMSSFIDNAAFEIQSRPETDSGPNSASGRTIGHFRLGAAIGTGAMGAVYEAQQENPRRTVALKLMRAMPGRDAWTGRLFHREGQALARLQHPGIASIYEAGQTEDGWHYFAMERVHGRPLTQYVLELKLSLPERLELFTRICDAVHYAHQRGVIHRDLKPSNILVTEDSKPKILDFGLARIIDPDADMTQITQAGVFHGTLAYASPEQARGDGVAIDARSDVYALGVILYELLTDRLPYELKGVSLPDAARMICEQAPRRPAAVLADDPRRSRQLRGDLETIVSKALEKQPDRRYASAAALADDVRRYLGDEPIEARRDSALYVFGKALRRYRRAATVGAAFVVVLVGAVIGEFVQWRHSEAARKRAELAEHKQTLLRVAADDARDEAKRQATDARRAEAEALRGKRQFQHQSDSFEVLLQVRGNLAGAVPYFRDELARMRARHPDEPLHLASFIHNLAAVLGAIGEYPEAIRLYREVVEIQRARGERPLQLAQALSELGRLLYETGAYDEAEKLFRESINIAERAPRRTADGADSYLGLGQTLVRLGKFRPAEKRLLAAWGMVAKDPHRPDRLQKTIDGLIELYEKWDESDPGGHHAAKAAEWRARKEAPRVALPP